MAEEKKAKNKGDYEVEEAERTGEEINSWIEKLQNLNYGEHVHLQTSETLCF
ncbi:hypothetical protein HYX03_04745 [Candidatus Woesearchaeota archaeon]|nr:hypothetical protein [Candidatus Woesearchaeota archaeon]